MEKRIRHMLLLVSLMTGVVLSCKIGAEQLISPSVISGNVETYVAQTWAVMEAQQVLSATSTNTLGPTDTPILPTETPTPTLTVTPTPTETPVPPLTQRPTNTPGPTPFTLTPIPPYYPPYYPPSGGGGGSGGGSISACYAAKLIMDVTFPEGAILPPSTAFTKIWRIQNVGGCMWDSSFSFVFVAGDRMGGENIRLSRKVKPGATIDIAVPMISPSLQDGYTGKWMFRTGHLTFGSGNESAKPFEVAINVAIVSHGVVFDFANRMCTASWRSSEKSLKCPTKLGSRSGFVVRRSGLETEAGPINKSIIWSHPEMVVGGWIKGTFTGLLIQPTDHFITDLGCAKDFTGCNLTFRLYYQIYDSDPVLLGEWPEVYDGALTHVDYDLTGLAGQTASIILYVIGNGPHDQNAALWISPQLSRP